MPARPDLDPLAPLLDPETALETSSLADVATAREIDAQVQRCIAFGARCAHLARLPVSLERRRSIAAGLWAGDVLRLPAPAERPTVGGEVQS